MDDIEQFGDLDDQITSLDENLGDATEMAAAFNAELARVRNRFAETGQDVATLERGISNGLNRAIRGAVVQGDSLSTVLEKVTNSLINAAFNSAIKPVTDQAGGLLSQGIGNAIGSLFTFAKGGSFSQGKVQPFANGGVVNGPVNFPMRGGIGLMGEAGSEAIMPLSRGADGKLGVRSQGGGGSVNVVMNVRTPGCRWFQTQPRTDCSTAWPGHRPRRPQPLSQRESDMEFHEVRLPSSLSFGSVGGPERLTDVVTLANGFEQRNTPWAHSRRRYDAGVAMRSLDDIEVLIAFFEARQGQIYGFRWKDWTDYKSSTAQADPEADDQVIAYGDDTTAVFPLIKTYRSGDHVYVRPITKPVRGSVRVALDEDEQQDGVHYEVNIRSQE